ncbi:MAG: bifunctional serine/threonine protein kinase/MFS transporter [Planctomycetota bacterium]
MPREIDETQDPTPIPGEGTTPPENPGSTPNPAPGPARTTQASATAGDPSLIRTQRFNPGDTLAGRYRVVAFLGRGGMGEVYRADDLELAQSVAIKLLPSHVAADANLTERVRAEVRMARGISHKNVCRIHDIARLPDDQGGDLFISMEYVDGEDLQTLLRRIGKLPQDKAIDVARQLCAALAAAHDQGVIHRDLKPANVMLDGRGNVRLTDFGIAAIDEGAFGEGAFGDGAFGDVTTGAEANAGTPAYMAPEQFEGRAVSKASDIYALGLVIFETLTGKPAWDAKSYAELRTLREATATPVGLSSISTRGIDPALAALVERCTETDPADRPASALAVAAALPGADPVAAAIAAGETPSPELIAASGGKGALKPAIAMALTGAIIVFTALSVLLGNGTTLLTTASAPSAPVLMEETALEVLESLGHSVPDDAPIRTGWNYSGNTLARVATAISTEDLDSWDALSEPTADPLLFWLRLEPDGFSPINPAYVVDQTDPAPVGPGAVQIMLDGQRRLQSLKVIPQTEVRGDDRIPSTQEPDWSIAFEAAGLDVSLFEPTETIRRDGADADVRRGWRGVWPDPEAVLPEHEIEVFAGAADGRIVEFSIWRADPAPEARIQARPEADGGAPSDGATQPGESSPTEASTQPEEPETKAPGQDFFGETPPRHLESPNAPDAPPPARINADSVVVQYIAGIARLLVFLIITVVAGVMAYRNYRLGRCDLRRATTLGLTVFGFTTLSAALGADVSIITFEAFVGPFPLYAYGLGFALVLIACYIAVEPLARSRWPGSLVSWTRLFGGAYTDPMIGRDLLLGIAAGVAVRLAASLAQFFAPILAPSIGADTGLPTMNGTMSGLTGMRDMLGLSLAQVAVGLINAAALAFVVLIVMVLLGLLKVKRRWPAIAIVVVLVAAQSLVAPNQGPLDRIAMLAGVTLVLVVLDRVGLLAAAATITSMTLLSYFVDLAPYDQWWAPSALTPAVIVGAFTLFALRTSTAGKSLFAPTATR